MDRLDNQPRSSYIIISASALAHQQSTMRKPNVVRLGHIAILTLVLVLASDPLLEFLPKWISIPLSAATLAILVYRYIPSILSRRWGAFSNSSSVKWANTIYACCGFLWMAIDDFQPSHLWPYPAALITGLVILSVVWGRGYQRFSSARQRLEFWVAIEGDRSAATTELMDIHRLPKSKIRAAEIFMWKYVPGAALVVVPTAICLLVSLLEAASVLFALILTSSLAWYIWRWTRRKKTSGLASPEGEFSDRFLKGFLQSGWFSSSKGSHGIICVSLGIACAASSALIGSRYFSFLQHPPPEYQPTGLAFTILFALGLAILLSSSYQFYFWYIILRRYRSFIAAWKHVQTKPASTPSLPRGGYFAFLLSCLSPAALPAYTLIPSNFTAHLLGSISVVLIGFYTFLLISSVKRRTNEITESNVGRDNLRIPLSALLASCGLSVYWILVSETTSMVPILLSSALFACIVFYLQDTNRHLQTKFGDSLTGKMLNRLYLALAFVPFIITVLFESDPRFRTLGYVALGVGVVLSVVGIILDVMRHLVSPRTGIEGKSK